MMFYFSFIFVTVSVILNVCTCYPLSDFYNFSSAAGDNELPANDDGSTSRIPISVPFPFFGSSYNSIYVNNNGDVTFETPLRQYTSQPFPINGSHRIIAPFWTDIDTRQGGKLWYRTTTEATILQRGTAKINSLFPDIVPFTATWMMVTTWEDVAAFGCSAITCQQRNTFQLVLINNGNYSFVVFNYNKINWTKSAQVGFNAGDGEHYYSVNGSMTDAVLNLPQMSNIGIPGQFVFRVDQVKIANADIVDECASSPCVHGNCSNEYLYYECICDPGYTGVNCESEINECQSSPCIHGNCSDHLDHYTCHCQDGFSGTNCQTDMVDECVSSPCVHGNCSNEYLHYECICYGGYTGVNCETEINECQSSPCLHGNCSDHLNHYTCHCQDGFTGTNCQTDINECASSPCVHGSCVGGINGYVCTCQSGYTGINCEVDINECATSPCINGTCTDQVNGYSCECIPGYTGVNCEAEANFIDGCAGSPCEHGVCINEINNYVCVCDTGYSGRECSEFNFAYLIPLFVGLPVLSFVAVLLWKRFKRDSEFEMHGVLHFSDAPLGPTKTSFQTQTQSLSTTSKVVVYMNLLWQRIMNVIKLSGKISTFSKNSSNKVQTDELAFQVNKTHVVHVDQQSN